MINNPGLNKTLFLMPAVVVTSILMVRKRALALVGLPALFIVGAGSRTLVLAELLKPGL
jgi:hypothetical protein